MAFFRPSILQPGRYIRSLLYRGTYLEGASWHTVQSSAECETDVPCSVPLQSRSSTQQCSRKQCPSWAAQPCSTHHYHSGPMLRALSAQYFMFHMDQEDRKQGIGRTAFGVVSGSALQPGSFLHCPGVRTHMGHNHSHGAKEPLPSEGEKVVRLGFWSDVGLTVGKAAAGYISGSTAMIADAAHSFSDIALSGVSLWSLRAAAVPKDKEHPYGHGKYESLGAFGVSVLLIATGAGIAWNALEALQAIMGPALASASSSLPDALSSAHTAAAPGHVHGDHSHAMDLNHLEVALAASLLSLAVKEGLYRQTKKVGERTGSQLLMANAWHHRSDAVSSLVALVGVCGAYLGVPWLDPMAGMLLAGMIVKAGFDIATNSVKELVDTSVPETVLSSLRETAMAVPGVKGCHRVRARNMGSNIVSDLVIDVDPFLSVSASHNVAEVAKLALRKKNPSLVDVVVHVEPEDSLDDPELPPHHTSETTSAPPLTDTAADWPAQHAHTEGGSMQETQAHPLEHPHSHEHSHEAALDQRIHNYPLQADVEAQVRELVRTRFHQVLVVPHVTCHFLEGGTVCRLTIQVDPATTIKEAAQLGRKLEDELERSLSNVKEADVHLELNEHLEEGAPRGRR